MLLEDTHAIEVNLETKDDGCLTFLIVDAGLTLDSKKRENLLKKNWKSSSPM